tara:strand:+ start:2472 stop:3074 length:603 start_codon:yes stop_codon:yes gene_type:complete
MKILIINAGGNILSLKNILFHCGFEAKVYDGEDILSDFDLVFLPGIGSFDKIIENLNKINLIQQLKKIYHRNSTHLVGICVGMQILFDNSEEGKLEGLGLIPGNVKKFLSTETKAGLHMGWNEINTKKFKDFDKKKFYFAHNYYVECNNKYIISTSNHLIEFPTIVQNKNVIGIQFHPEKSHKNGINLIKFLLNNIVNVN